MTQDFVEERKAAVVDPVPDRAPEAAPRDVQGSSGSSSPDGASAPTTVSKAWAGTH
ncbi:hypothetical protein ACFSLT_25320 [Novosphingobium resinovorum]